MSDKLNDLTDDELNELSEAIIKKLTERAYIKIGKEVVGASAKFFFYVGVVVVVAYSFLKAKGWI